MLAPSLVAVGCLYLLDFLLMVTLVLIAGLVVMTGVQLPRNMSEEIDLSWGWIAVIVIGAPLTQEIILRSRLSGRPRHLTAAILGAGITLLLVRAESAADARQAVIANTAGIVFAAVVALLLVWRWSKRAPLRWFGRYLRAIFSLVTLTFGFIHLLNFVAAPLMVLIPLAAPQIVAGSLFGYACVQYGSWAAILLRAMHNGSAVLVACWRKILQRSAVNLETTRVVRVTTVSLAPQNRYLIYLTSSLIIFINRDLHIVRIIRMNCKFCKCR